MNEADTGRGQEFLKARKIIFRLLKYRLRSEKEVADKLEQKEISSETVSKTVRYFKDIGLLDDRLFSRGWISSRLKKPMGFSRIRHELRQKGVSDEIIQAECAGASDEYDELESIRALAQRRMKQYKNLDITKAKRRLYGYLIRRGFSPDLVFKAVREAKKS